MVAAPITEFRRGGNLVKHQVLSRIRRRRSADPVAIDRFSATIAALLDGADAALVHVGLSDVNAALPGDPYDVVIETLTDHVESVVVPGFTDYFATSGVFHKQYSRPKHGTFARLFLADADYRTDDAMKSFLVAGPYRFSDCVHDDSYHPDGCFASLVADDVTLVNVGTPWVTCSHLHYLEAIADVPYVTRKTFDGVLIDDTELREIEQDCHRYTSPYYSWNKPKLQRDLRRDGSLTVHDLEGLFVAGGSLREIVTSVERRLASDPHYLVTV